MYERRNQRWKPRKSSAGSNLADQGRSAAHARTVRTTPMVGKRTLRGGHKESLRRTYGEAAGEKLGASSVNRYTVNVGTVMELPSGRPARSVVGRSVVLQMASWRGGVLVVVRDRENRLHGEGGQRIRRFGIGMSGDRR